MQALLHDAQGDEASALEKLSQSLALAEPGGFIRPFADLGPEMAALLQEFVARGIADGSLGATTVRYLNRIFAAFSEPVAGHDVSGSVAG